MGQHQSKPPSHAPTPDLAQPYPVAASGWLKSTRRRKTGARNDTVASPNHRFIPQQQRQRSAGPIRSRPQPSEYGVARPTFSALLSPEETPLNRPTPETGPAALPVAAQTQPSALVSSADTYDVQSHRRWSGGQHLAASPRQSPLQKHAKMHEDQSDSRHATSAAFVNHHTSQHRVLHHTAIRPASGFRRSWPHRGLSPSFVEEPLTDHDDMMKHEPSRERTDVKLLPASPFLDPIMQSTATTSLGNDPNLSYAHHGIIAPASVERRKRTPDDHSISGLPAQAASDVFKDSLAPKLGDQNRLRVLRSSHSGYAPSSDSSLGTTEVERLRQGPELKLHRDSVHAVFSSQTPSSPSRSRALIAKLRGIKISEAEDPAVKTKVAATELSSLAPTSTSSGRKTRSRSVPQLQFATKSVVGAHLPSTALQQSQPQMSSERRSSEPSLLEPCSPLPPQLGESREGVSLASSNSSLLLMGERRSSPPKGVVRGSATREAGAGASKRNVSDTDPILQAHVKPPKLETGQSALAKDNDTKRSESVEADKVKEQGGFWNWPRRSSTSRILRFGLSGSRSGRHPRIEIEDAPSSRFEVHQPPVSPRSMVNVVGMTSMPPSTVPKQDAYGPSVGSSTRSSFSSLAPPVPPSPLPPLRPTRRGSQQTQITFRQDRIGSADSSFSSGLAEAKNGRSTTSLHQAIPEESVPPPPSATVVSAVSAASETGPSTSALASGVGRPSTAATSLSAAPERKDSSGPIEALKGTFGGKKGYLSPSPANSRPLSETSDAGTKEILLSDRESLAGPKMSSDTFARGSFEERHPDLQSYYPASAFLSSSARPRFSGTSPSPLSRMAELDGETFRMRHVGAVPDVSASTASRNDDNSGNDQSVDPQHEQIPRPSRSFHSARSFRSTSDASVQPFRPLPAVPVRNRGYSLDPAFIQRVSGQKPGTSFSPAKHVQAESLGYSSTQEIDGLPPRNTQPTFMLMGMVAAATSPTEATHSSHDRNSIGGENYARRTSRSSIGSLTSHTAEPHTLPSTLNRNAAMAVEAEKAQSKGAFRRPTSLVVPRDAQEGPPLSPSAFYEGSCQRLKRPVASPMGPRQSWSSAEDQSSAAVMTPISTQGLVRGIDSPGDAKSEGSVFGNTLVDSQMPSTWNGNRYSSTLAGTPDDDQEDELLQLEKSRSGRDILLPPPPSSKDIDLPDSVERAPYADTGVQASLAALRARESPGESLRTILARQRILGEPDDSMTEFLRESNILDTESRLEEEAMRAVSGPRRRRRSAPYPQSSGSRYSSDELSSSGRSLSGFRAEAARRRRQRNITGMADASGSWVSGTGVRESDSESTMLTAIRLGRSLVKNASADTGTVEGVSDLNVHEARREASVASETTEMQPARGIVSASSVAPRRESVSPVQDRFLRTYQDEHAGRPKRPRHQRYVTALSQSDSTAPSAQPDVQLPDTVAQSDTLRSSQSNEDGRAHTTSRSVSMPHAHTKLIRHGSKHGLEASNARTTKFPAEAPDDRMTQRMLAQRQRQRSHSDTHTSASRSSKFTSRRTGRLDDERSRYDAQIEDLLLLREKVLQLEASIGHVRQTDLRASFDDDQRGSVSMEDPTRRSRKSSISSKRKSRPSKLGYTMPDIVAWQAGLGDSISSNRAGAMQTSSTVA